MRWLLMIASTLLMACSGTQITHSCDSTDAFEIKCNIQQPEDLAVLPDNKGLLVAEFADVGENNGHFSHYIHANGSYRILFPTKGNNTTSEMESTDPVSADLNWGEKNCRPTATISPHGIHFSKRDETYQLLAINHGENEQVLMFEVVLEPEVNLINRGCVNFPESAFLNDVVALPGGGLAASTMLDKNHQIIGAIKGLSGRDTGFVWRWSATTGLAQLKNTQGAMPNGLEIDKSGEHLFINMYLNDKVVKYSLADEQPLASITIKGPDNSSWSDNGKLIISSHPGPLTEYILCVNLRKGSCGSSFDLVAVDVENMTSKILYQHKGGGPFGPATIAVQDKDLWYLGSFAGDRLAILKL